MSTWFDGSRSEGASGEGGGDHGEGEGGSGEGEGDHGEGEGEGNVKNTGVGSVVSPDSMHVGQQVCVYGSYTEYRQGPPQKASIDAQGPFA